MTDSAILPEENKTEELPEIPHVFYQGVPVFFATEKDIKDKITKKYNFSAYYLLGNESIYSEKDKKYINGPVTLFLVTQSVVGTSIQPVYNAGFATIEQSSKYSLPKIPQKMVATIDAFFRKVYELHGSEAIVILTYDTSKEGSEGWGWVAPKQSNTSVHCNYDPQSLIGLFPNDTTFQVGTAHSHPGMDAYKSGTDHADQMKASDGLHVTFGWKKSYMNGATQYYAEIQFSQATTTVNFESLIESYKGDIDTTAVDEALAKVEKSAPTTVTGHWEGSDYSYFGYIGGTNYTSSQSSKYGSGSQYTPSVVSKKRLTLLPDTAPDPSKSTILIPTFLDPATNKHACSGCGTELLPAEVEKRSCLICKMPIYISPEEGIDQIIAQRMEAKFSYFELDIHNNAVKNPIYKWIITGKVNDFQLLYNPHEVDPGK